MQDTFLTVEEAARRLAVTPYTLREWLKAGKLRGVQVSRRWRVPERALNELAASAPAATSASTATKTLLSERRAAIAKARGSMRRRDCPGEVGRFLEEKHADIARENSTETAGARA